QVNNITIGASNIQNNVGALLSTVLPAGGLPGVTGALPGVSLTLNAVNNIMNAGTISSAGSLTMNAGGSIVNSAGSAGVGTAPVIQAVSDVSLNSALGNIVNTG